MSRESLQTWLMAQPAFSDLMRPVVLECIQAEFPALLSDRLAVESEWPYLLRAASLLCDSKDESALQAALRIAIACIDSKYATKEQKLAAQFVLSAMANFPTIQLARARGYVPDGGEISTAPSIDWVRHEVLSSIALPHNRVLKVNSFQKELWLKMESSLTISASAPTSAGKSYLIRRYIVEFLRLHGPAFIVYLVPTRALVQEVSDALRDTLNEEAIQSTIHTLPTKEDFSNAGAHVCVFTQERLQILLAGSNFQDDIALLIVDEAHKIGDGARGVLLEQVLSDFRSRFPAARTVYASPHVDNPEILLDGANNGNGLVDEPVATVAQNVVWASQVRGKPQQWTLTFWYHDKEEEAGRFSLAASPNPSSKRLSFVAHALGSGDKSGNLVYANRPSDAETLAIHIASLRNDVEKLKPSPSKEIADLIALVGSSIHPNYALVYTLPQRVAFHYGNMPLLVRTELERLFRDGQIQFLVCTGTLMEGVNLPCRSVYVRGPKRGIGNPMNEGDFWNLAGRAGRWGMEFQGSIVCVDPRDASVWETPPPTKKVKQRISRASNSALGDGSSILAFLRAGSPVEKEVRVRDQLVSFLHATFVREGSLNSLRSRLSVDEETIQGIEGEIANSIGKLPFPAKIITDNPGILPAAMSDLFFYFESQSENLEKLVPSPPESEESKDNYFEIFALIAKLLRADFGGDGRIRSLANLTVQWMKGVSLARLIANRLKFGGSSKSEATVIRNVMEDVENFARFSAPKFLKCYCDLLRAAAGKVGRDEIFDGIPDLPLYLEFGVSAPTHLALISLGLSRTSALELLEKIVVTDMNKEQVLEWLASHPWQQMGLSAIVAREVSKIIAGFDKTVGHAA